MVSEIATRVMLKTLRRAGWSYLRDAKGSHTIWACPTGKHQTPGIPEGHRTISPGVRRNIEKAITDCDCQGGQR